MSNLLAAQFEGGPALVVLGDEVIAARLALAMEDPRAHDILAQGAAVATADDEFWPEAGSWLARLRPYTVRDGVLQIPVKGALLADLTVAWGSYATGYPYIERALARGLDDPAVRGIALVCDSPGGAVAGCFELADKIFAARDRKPLRAFASPAAYSAAYALASAAERIVVSRSGGVGSIGVVTSHRDVSGAMAAAGVKVTFVHFGAHKVDGNAFEPLPDAVRARMQTRIDELGAEFVATVARNRGLTDQAVRDTEALTFSAAEAVENGLADEVGSLDDALAAFAAGLTPPKLKLDLANMITPEAHAAALAEATATATAAAVTAASARIAAIMSDPRSKGRERAALALPGSMSAEDVLAFVDANVPAAGASTAAARLDALVPDPDVAADTAAAAAPAAAAGLAAAVTAAGGR